MMPSLNVPDVISDIIKESISKDGNQEADNVRNNETGMETDDKETQITVPDAYGQDDNREASSMDVGKEADGIRQLNGKVMKITGILLALLLAVLFLLKRREWNE